MNDTAVIILAGGAGNRMNSSLPKQFLPIAGKPILMHTIERFAETLGEGLIIVVLPQGHMPYWKSLCEEYRFAIPHRLCGGGANRFESVKCGLRLIGDAKYVAVHDGVRPLVSDAIIARTIADAKAFGAAIPVVMAVDSLRVVDETGSRAVNRRNYRIVQTPQVFRTDIITDAYSRPYDEAFTDDASVVEANGGTVALSEGSYYNIKITTPVDIVTAEAMIASMQSENR